MRTWAVLTLAVGLLVAAASQDAASQADLDKLQGEWKMTSYVIDGKEGPADVLKDFHLTIQGDRYRVKTPKVDVELIIKLDAGKSPKELDLTYATGENKGKTNRAIYKIEGDTFTLCRHQQPEQERPKEFASKPDSKQSVAVWKRAKK